MKYKKIMFVILSSFSFFSCQEDIKKNDASGAFEADEIIISSQANGQIESMNLDEGSILKQNDTIGYIDTTLLHINKKLIKAQINAILSKRPNASSQIATLEEQLKSAKYEQERIKRLIEADVATHKQLDDINTQVDVIQKQIDAQQSTLYITTRGINKDAETLKVQMEQIDEQIRKSLIINPIDGVVLAQYAENKEMAIVGKPLYKIADISTLILRAYITAEQLYKIKLNQEVTVRIDQSIDTYKDYTGTISWISSKAEFTPKTILTKPERADLVYAIKIKVKNDGLIKIGMYGEVIF